MACSHVLTCAVTCAQTADKAVVEIFPEPSSADMVLEVVRQAVSPGQVTPISHTYLLFLDMPVRMNALHKGETQDEGSHPSCQQPVVQRMPSCPIFDSPVPKLLMSKSNEQGTLKSTIDLESPAISSSRDLMEWGNQKRTQFFNVKD